MRIVFQNRFDNIEMRTPILPILKMKKITTKNKRNLHHFTYMLIFFFFCILFEKKKTTEIQNGHLPINWMCAPLRMLVQLCVSMRERAYVVVMTQFSMTTSHVVRI